MVATELFHQNGFSASTMRDLAGRLNIEAASLYNHIKSKDEMLEAVCLRIANSYAEHLGRIEQEGTAAEQIAALIRLHVRMIIDDKAAVSVANNEWKHLKEPALTTFKSIRRDYERRFAAIIERGIREGVFRQVNASVALFTILSSVRWVELWFRPDRGIDPQTLENDMVTMLLNGLQQ